MSKLLLGCLEHMLDFCPFRPTFEAAWPVALEGPSGTVMQAGRDMLEPVEW